MDSQTQFDNWLKKYGTGGWRMALEHCEKLSALDANYLEKKRKALTITKEIMDELQDICEKRANELCGVKG